MDPASAPELMSGDGAHELEDAGVDGRSRVPRDLEHAGTGQDSGQIGQPDRPGDDRPADRRSRTEVSARPVPRLVTAAVPDVAGARPAPVSPRAADQGAIRMPGRDPVDGDSEAEPPRGRATCTAPQLRRFIKSRAYVPMHELRRRFSINGQDDDVSAVDVGGHRVYVGLPPAEGRMLGDLLRSGDVGYELSMDPETPVVVGVYAMRPVSRG